MILNKSQFETFFTPEEIAEKLKLSTATVYKLLTEETLPYFRVGKSYRIPSQAFSTYMLQEGNLTKFLPSTPETPSSVKCFVKYLELAARTLQQQVLALILFGSYARGDYGKDSDIDLLVIVNQNTPQLRQKISEISSAAMSEGGFEEFLSAMVVSVSHWKKLGSIHAPLYKEIQKEGMILWPKTSRSLKDIAIEPKKNLKRHA